MQNMNNPMEGMTPNYGSVTPNSNGNYNINQAPGQTYTSTPYTENIGVKTMAPTSLHELQTYAKGTLIRFPDFAEGQPFVARVKRPSLLVLAKSGKIPNTLLNAAGELFAKGGAGMDTDNENMLAEMYDIMEIVCEAALIEPTMQDIKNAGLTLCDDQMMEIFSYTQAGVKALESFRQE